MIDGYRIPATCPECGGLLDVTETGSPADTETRRTANAWCADCTVVWRVEVTMSVVDDMRETLRPIREAELRDAAGLAL